ncbi:Hypothetical predicted protein, partial [Xyrichtys novacula]
HGSRCTQEVVFASTSLIYPSNLCQTNSKSRGCKSCIFTSNLNAKTTYNFHLPPNTTTLPTPQVPCLNLKRRSSRGGAEENRGKEIDEEPF